MEHQESHLSLAMRRIIAGLEALMTAGVLYLVVSDQQRKEDMTILKTTGAITAQAVANIPDVMNRLTRVEVKSQEHERRIGVNEANIEGIKNKDRLK